MATRWSRSKELFPLFSFVSLQEEGSGGGEIVLTHPGKVRFKFGDVSSEQTALGDGTLGRQRVSEQYALGACSVHTQKTDSNGTADRFLALEKPKVLE